MAEDKTQSKWVDRLRAQPVNRIVIVGFLLVALIPMVFLGVKLHRAAWDDAWREINEKHRLLAENLAFPISMYVDNHRAVLDLLSHALAELAEENQEHEAEHEFEDHLLYLKGIVSLTWVDADGQVIVHRGHEGGKDIAPLAFASDETFRRARDAQSWAISGTKPSPANQQPVLVLALPVLNYEKQAFGVLLAELNVGVVEGLRQAVSFGAAGYATVIDEKGHVIAHPKREWISTMRDLSQLQAVRAALDGKTGTAEFFSPFLNEEVVGGYASVPDLHWGILVEQPRTEVEDQIKTLVLNQLAWALGGLLLAIPLAVAIARWITRPINLLAGGVERVVSNNFNGEVPLLPSYTPREVQILADGVRKSLRGLQQSRRQVGEFNYALQRRVEESTAQLREANARLEQAAQDAKRASEAKSDFLASMSHEIRTPMNGILGMIDLLLRSGLTEKQHGFADKIRRSAGSLLAIINDILDLSKIEANKLKLESRDFDLREVLEEKIDLLAQSAHANGLGLVCHLPTGVPTRVRGDATRLCQVLTNLVGNAVKFTDEGDIVVRGELLDETHQYVLFKFYVKDTGVGIPEDVRDHMFEAFNQGEPGVSRKYVGTGLGLAISKRLVTAMGGDIGVSSAPGEGTEFWFTIRFQKQARQGAAKPDTVICEVLQGMKVLAVDRKAAQRSILEEQLCAWQMRTTVTSSADGAAQLLAEAAAAGDPFELVLFDEAAGGDDLAGAMQHIRDSAGGPIQVILLSMPRPDELTEATGLEIAAQVFKPLRQSQLYDCIAQVMQAHRTVACVPAALARKEDRADPTPLAGHILLAEDNPVNTEVAKELLSQLGLTFHHVEDGHGVLEALDQQCFDMVLMDCQMPDMDGLQATQALRGREREGRVLSRLGGRLPVVALTANAMDGDREMCLTAGMDDYLSKPFTQEQLVAMLRRWLPRPTPQAHAAPVTTAEAQVGSADATASFPDDEVTVASEPVQQEAPVAAPNEYSAPDVPAANETPAELPLLQRVGGEALDKRALGRLRDLQRDAKPDLLRKVVTLYLQDSATALQRLRSAAEGTDPEEVARLAHRLKSSSANLGALHLADVLRRVEAAGRRGELADLSPLLGDIDSEFQRVREALQRELAADSG